MPVSSTPAGDSDRPPGDDSPPGDESTGGGDSTAAPADAQPAAHPPTLDFGYYRIDQIPGGGESHAEVVNDWTNLCYLDWSADARAFDYDPGAEMSPVRANMAGLLARATSAGLSVMMDLAWGDAWGPRLTKAGILQTAAPYWSSVRYLILGDELQLSRDEANDLLAELRRAIDNLGLEPRPIGVTLTPQFVLSSPAPSSVDADWDFIAIEAYTPSCACGSCGTGTAAAEIDAVATQVAAQEARIPARTDLVMVLQAYDRNGAFADHETLAALNRATYFEMVKGNPRYLAMVGFNWHREGTSCAAHPYPTWGHGTSGLPGLVAVHQEIWRDLTTGP